MALALRLKPFGKDGLRILHSSDGAAPCVLEVSLQTDVADEDRTWSVHADLPAEAEGVVIVKNNQPKIGAVRSAAWRLRRDDAMSAVALFAMPAAAAPSAAFLSPVLPLDDAELAFNVLQWFGTIVIDCRPDDDDAPPVRLRESHQLCDAAAVAQLPPKDDAVAIGASREILDALASRARRAVHSLSDGALSELCERFPCLVARGDGAADDSKRPVLPNLVDGTLLVGHQGHALCIADWAHHVALGGVLNLAAAHVDAGPARDASAKAAERAASAGWSVFEVRCPSDGMPLTDKPGDGERLLEALPSALAALAESTTDGRLALVHCQQGRSRAGSIATARLLATHNTWSLLDGVRFLAARRPETEIADEYLRALERWATDTLGRPPSLERLREELPRQVRPPPRARSGSVIGGGAPAPAEPVGTGKENAAAAETAAETAPPSKQISPSQPPPDAGGGGIPPGSPLRRGGFGAAAIRRARTPDARTEDVKQL